MFHFVGRILGNILGSSSRKRKRQEEVDRESCDDNDCRCCGKRRKESRENDLRSEETNTSSSLDTDAPSTPTTEGTSTTDVNIAKANASSDTSIVSNSDAVLTTSVPILTDANIAKPTTAAVKANANIATPSTTAVEANANIATPSTTAVETNANISTPSTTTAETATAEKSSTPQPTTSVNKSSSTTVATAKDTKTVEATDKLADSTETIHKDPEVPKILDTEIFLNLSIDDKLEEDHVRFIREELIFPQVNKAAFISAGFPIERGLLLHGSSHGMHTFVKGFASELSRVFGKSTRIFSRTPLDIIKRYSDDANTFIERIKDSVGKCKEDTPIIVLIEELRSFLLYSDGLKDLDSTSFASFVSLLKTFLGDNSKYQRVFIIATVDNLQILPKSVQEPGMLRKRIHFPDAANDVRRRHYLNDAVKKWKVQPDDKLLDVMAKKTVGFSPQELHDLAQEVLESTVNDKIKVLLTESCSKCCALPDTLKVTESALKSINPTAEEWERVFKTLKKVEVKTAVQHPLVEPNANVTFSTVGGLDEQIKYLRENVIAPLKQKDVLKEWGVEPVRGIIFYGPPGTGKTLLAKAMVNELDKILEDQPETSATATTEIPKKKYTFFYRKATDCFAKYVGETERILRELFSAAQKQAPSVIFFDEFDGLCPNRADTTFQFHKNIVTTLLGLMDSVQRGEILIIAATNRLDSLDPAMRRAGRFDRTIGFPMPDKEGRENILQIHTKAWKNGNSKNVLEQMAEKTVGYSGADLEQLARETLVLGMKRFLDTKSPVLEVVLEDWHTALSQTKPSNNSGEIAFGNGLTFLQRVPDGVKLLLQNNMTKIEQKLQPMFTAIEEKSKINSSGGLNSFLISSGSDNDDVNRYLIPLLLTESKLFKNVAAYTLDLSDVRTLTRKSVQSTLAQLGSPPDGKIPLLFVPQIEAFTKLKNSEANAGGIVDYVLTQLQTLRGKEAILLATSKLALKNMQQNEEMLTLFKDIEGSKCHEFVPTSLVDLESFFKTNTRLEKEFPKQLECAVKFGVGKDVETLLDLYAEVQRILQQKKGEENKADDIVLEQLTSLLKAFDNHKKKGQTHFDLYI